jgi:hypothetical protein
MPKKVEKMIKAMRAQGMSKNKAYAVATAQYNKMKIRKKG